jgi:hypothetical protein
MTGQTNFLNPKSIKKALNKFEKVIQVGAEILAEFLTLKLNILTATKVYEIWRLFSIFSLVFENKFFFEKSLV